MNYYEEKEETRMQLAEQWVYAMIICAVLAAVWSIVERVWNG